MRPLAILGSLLVVLGALALGGGGMRTFGAQDATPAASPGDCPTTTPEQNKEIAVGYFEVAYNEKQPTRVGEFLADDFTRRNANRPHDNQPGTADDAARVEENLKDFPDLHIAIEDTLAERDKVMVRLNWTGTHRDPIEAWGSPATGRRVSYELIAVYRVACGKLAEQWLVLDYLTMLRQTGLITDDELATAGEPTVATPEP
jgi:steroid delta-isomerase-like uncharacterized protein